MGDVSRFEKLNCEVSIVKRESYYEVRFDTLGFGCIVAKIDEKGKIQICTEGEFVVENQKCACIKQPLRDTLDK